MSLLVYTAVLVDLISVVYNREFCANFERFPTDLSAMLLILWQIQTLSHWIFQHCVVMVSRDQRSAREYLF